MVTIIGHQLKRICCEWSAFRQNLQMWTWGRGGKQQNLQMWKWHREDKQHNLHVWMWGRGDKLQEPWLELPGHWQGHTTLRGWRSATADVHIWSWCAVAVGLTEWLDSQLAVHQYDENVSSRTVSTSFVIVFIRFCTSWTCLSFGWISLFSRRAWWPAQTLLWFLPWSRPNTLHNQRHQFCTGNQHNQVVNNLWE